VSSVASVLTVSVSKAWSTNISALSGEGRLNHSVEKRRHSWSWITETPPGQESRLTRAMKAYHITQAQSPSDLPDWLFDERERRVANRPSDSDDSLVRSQLLQNNRKRTVSSKQLTSALVSTEPVPTQSQLRGTDRLKAMRETKQRIKERDAPKFSQANTPTYLPRQSPIGLPFRPQWWSVIFVGRDFDWQMWVSPLIGRF